MLNKLYKAVVIGDCHFYNAYPSFDYLGEQFKAIEKIVKTESPEYIIFLGDIFHFRKPDPETIVRVTKFILGLKNVSSNPDPRIILIRGNHDTAAKSDTASLCVLEILDHNLTQANIDVVKDYYCCAFSKDTDFHFIAHYDDENKIKEYLSNSKFTKANNYFFGHFGFKGCINPNGDEDSPLSLDVFTNPTFLGHIHKAQDEGNVHVVGTPYSTAFAECDNNHRYAVIYGDSTYEFKRINHGIRYLQFDLGSLEANKDLISDANYKTILRVYLNQILDQNSVDLRKKIMEEYKVSYVDIKYLPMSDEKEQHSTYRSKSMVFELNDDLIMNYINECKTEIPANMLIDGLKLLKGNDDS